MTGKSVLVACSDTAPQIIAEAAGVLPILWLALLSEDDVTACENMRLIRTVRTEAIERCADALPFVTLLFPEIRSLESTWEKFRTRLTSCRCDEVGLDISEEVQANPDIGLLKIYVAVQSLRRRLENTTFACPSRCFKHPVTGELMRIAPKKYQTTREVLCYVASIDLSVDEDEYHLIGTLAARRAKR